MLFEEKLKSKTKIFLDGGNGSEIAKLGGDMSPAFSALATLTSPDILVTVLAPLQASVPLTVNASPTKNPSFSVVVNL